MKRKLIGFFLVTASAAIVSAQEAGGRNPELVLQVGHRGWIRSITYSPNGSTLATASGDRTVKLWDARSAMLKQTLSGHSSEVVAVAFSPDGQTLASAALDTTIKLWDPHSGRLRQTLDTDRHQIHTLTFSPDGKTLASGGGVLNGEVKLWDAETGRLRQTLSDTTQRLGNFTLVDPNATPSVGICYTVAFSPDGRALASAGADKILRIWDAQTGRLIRTLIGHADTIWSIAFAPNGRTLASASADKTVRLWNPWSGRPLRSIDNNIEAMTSVAFSPDGVSLATAGQSGITRLSDPETGELQQTLTGNNMSVWAIAFSPDSRTVATGSGDWTVKFWNARSGELEQILPSHFGGVRSVAWSPDGGILITGGDQAIRLWDSRTGRMKHFIKQNGTVNCVAFSPDGRTFATATESNVTIWDIETGESQLILKGHTNFVYSIAFSPDSSKLVTGSEDKSVRFWDAQTGKLEESLPGQNGAVYSVAFSPDGQIVASGGEGRMIKLWDAHAHALLRTIEEDSGTVYSLAFSPDSNTLATGNGGKQAQLWDVPTGDLVRTFTAEGLIVSHNSSVHYVAFSRDGQTIASASYDATAKLWDVKTGALRRSLSGHADDVRSICFSPDGNTIASASNDTTVKIWSAGSGRLLVTLLGLNDGSWIEYTEDGYYSATKNARRAVGFRVDELTYPFEQFDLKLNRPDILLERINRSSPELRQAYKSAYLKRLRLTGFTEEALRADFHLPQVSLLSGNLPVKTKERTLTFKVVAVDTRYALDRLNVYVNDVPAFGKNGIKLNAQHVRKIEREITLKLSSGRNKIQVSVINEKGAESLKETFTVSYDGPSTKPDLYLAAIGVSRYRESLYNLKYADRDAHDICTFLANNKERFGRIFIRQVLNGDATKENIQKVKAFFGRARVDDEVVLFLAGHGLLDEKLDYYFGTTDVDFSHPSARGLSYVAIEDLLDGIPARKKLLLMDTCHAGEVDKEETTVIRQTNQQTTKKQGLVKQRRFPRAEIVGMQAISLSTTYDLLRELFDDLRRGSGATVISAASGVEYSYESHEWKNGVFTYSLLEGVKRGKADQNKDGIIRVSELRDYVIERVQQLTNGRQKPTVRRENLDNDFRVF
jgi:WD40 repeat protein